MEKSNFALYKEEREGAVVIETEKGFATAVELGDYIYLDEVFVRKEYRRSRECYRLADKIAEIGKELGYKKMLGSVCTDANNSTTSLKVLLNYGFKLLKNEKNMIYFEKEI